MPMPTPMTTPMTMTMTMTMPRRVPQGQVEAVRHRLRQHSGGPNPNPNPNPNPTPTPTPTPTPDQVPEEKAAEPFDEKMIAALSDLKVLWYLYLRTWLDASVSERVVSITVGRVGVSLQSLTVGRVGRCPTLRPALTSRTYSRTHSPNSLT